MLEVQQDFAELGGHGAGLAVVDVPVAATGLHVAHGGDENSIRVSGAFLSPSTGSLSTETFTGPLG